MEARSTGPYSSLLNGLLARGFVQVEQVTDSRRFGNELVALRNGNLAVRFVRDRGQWFLDLAVFDSGIWFSPVVWQALLDQKLPPETLLSANEQSVLVLNRLDEIEALCNSDPTLLNQQLEYWQAARAAARRAKLIGDT